MTDDAVAVDLAAMARDVLDGIRFMVLGTIDDDGRARTSPVYFVPHQYDALYWVSDPRSHHSHNLARDNRLSAVIFDSTVTPGPDARAVYVTGTAEEIPPGELVRHLPHAFNPDRGAPAFTTEELAGDADRRLWVMHVDTWEVHIRGSDPTLGTGTDRRLPVALKHVDK
ncbi:MAG: pyridoxamine 5'-phosphate oxidase family protein [Actinomycetales bacterium]